MPVLYERSLGLVRVACIATSLWKHVTPCRILDLQRALAACTAMVCECPSVLHRRGPVCVQIPHRRGPGCLCVFPFLPPSVLHRCGPVQGLPEEPVGATVELLL